MAGGGRGRKGGGVATGRAWDPQVCPEAAPDTKDQGGQTASVAWPPRWRGGDTHLRAPGPSPPSPRCTAPASSSATARPTRAPAARTAVRALPGLPCRASDPWPSRERRPRRAFPGRAWRPRGARRRRGPSPWRPEEAAVCAARSPRTKRRAPLPAIVRPRPPR